MKDPDSDSREAFYRRCQYIVDDLHRRVAAGEYISEQQCKDLYGKDDYNAFMHQLRLQNADIDLSAMTPAMEWMHHSRYFLWKIDEERRQQGSHTATRNTAIAAIISAGAAILSAVIALFSVSQCSTERPSQCYINNSYSEPHKNEHENDQNSLLQPVPENGVNIQEKPDECPYHTHKPE